MNLHNTPLDAEADVSALLRQLIDLTREQNELIRAVLARSAVPITKAVRHEDRQVLALLPRIASSFGDLVFTTRDLWRHAEREDPELRMALQEVFQRLDKQTARKAGSVFRRLTGCPFGGFVLERVASTRDGALWMVTRE